jgi:hypothetical protein
MQVTVQSTKLVILLNQFNGIGLHSSVFSNMNSMRHNLICHKVNISFIIVLCCIITTIIGTIQFKEKVIVPYENDYFFEWKYDNCLISRTEPSFVLG